MYYSVTSASQFTVLNTTAHTTPVGYVLSEARVSIDQDLDPDEMLVKIVAISKKEPDPKDPQ